MEGKKDDMSSLLSHVETMRKELAAKEELIREAKQREENARRQVEQLSSVNSRLTEAKRAAMKEEYDSKVRDWVKDLDSKLVPEPLKQEFLASCEKFAERGDDTGVW